MDRKLGERSESTAGSRLSRMRFHRQFHLWLLTIYRKYQPNMWPKGVLGRVVQIGVGLSEFVLRSVIDLARGQASLEKLKSLKSAGVGTSVLVVGGGKSIDQVDWKRVARLQLDGELVVVTINNFFESPYISLVKPNLHLVSDPAYMPSGAPSGQRLFSLSDSKKNTMLFYPRNWDLRQVVNPFKDVIPFEDKPLPILNRSISPTRPRPYRSLTILKALAVCNYLKFDKVYVVGMDSNLYLGLRVQQDNRLFQDSVHGVGLASSPSVDISAHYPNGVQDYFNNLSFYFHEVNKYFSGLEIVNLDFKSAMDIFPKADPLNLVTNEHY